MTDAERYQKEFDQILKDTELRALRAESLRNIETLEQLFNAAKIVGIDNAAAWKTIETAPSQREGLLALINAVRTKREKRRAMIRTRVDDKAKAIAAAHGSTANILTEMRIALPFETTEEERQYIEEYTASLQNHPPAPKS